MQALLARTRAASTIRRHPVTRRPASRSFATIYKPTYDHLLAISSKPITSNTFATLTGTTVKPLS